MRKVILVLLVLLATSSVFAEEFVLSGFKLDLSKVKKSSYLSSGILNKSTVVNLKNAKLKLKAGTKVEFKTKKMILKKGFLDGNHTLNLDGNVIVLKDGGQVLMDVNYSDKKPTLISGQLLKNVKIKMGKHEFFAKALNDKIKRDIVISSNGYILSVFLLNDLNAKLGKRNFIFKSGTRLEFSKEMFGKNYYINSGAIKKPLKIQMGKYSVDVKAVSGDKNNIGFYEDSDISFLRLNEERSFKIKNQMIPFKKGGNMFFYKDGVIKSGYLAKEIIFKAKTQILSFKKSGRISFYKDAVIKSGYLSKETMLKVKGKTKSFRKGKNVYFDKLGEVKR